jgi:hypothetical protein
MLLHEPFRQEIEVASASVAKLGEFIQLLNAYCGLDIGDF